MNLKTYASLDAVGLSHLIRNGQTSWQAVAEAAIHAIQSLNPNLNAMVMDDINRTLAVGPIGDGTSALYGAPFLLKDVNQYSDHMPMTFSCAFFDGATSKPDSTLVKRWRDAGLIILGKSNTPEFANDFVTEPTFRGPTLNPWNAAITVGGSSGGAGSAVASGMVPFAHGTDLGGSIRIPASCCGVFGLKPSAGLNPVGPYLSEIASGLNSDHVLSRSVRDSAAALDAGAGPDVGQRYPVQKPRSSYLEATTKKPTGLRVGLAVQAPGGIDVDAEMAGAAMRTAKMLETMGHTVVDWAFPAPTLSHDQFDLLWMFDITRAISDRIQDVGREPERHELEAFTHYMRDRVARCSGQEYYDARCALHDAAVILSRAMDPIDIIVCPGLATDPDAVGAIDSRSDNFDFETWAKAGYGFAPFASPFNITGQPAASLPMETSKAGLPLGIQLAAKHGEDGMLLALCSQLEKLTGWRKTHPPIWAGDL